MVDHRPLTKPPVWFWIVSIGALFWNLIGVMAYVMDVTASADTIAAMSDQQQAQRAARPAWYIAAFAIAVFCASLGSIGLLLRNKWAQLLLTLSLVGVVFQQLYHFLLSDIGQTLATSQVAMTIMIPAIAVLLVVFAKHAASKAWIG